MSSSLHIAAPCTRSQRPVNHLITLQDAGHTPPGPAWSQPCEARPSGSSASAAALYARPQRCLSLWRGRPRTKGPDLGAPAGTSGYWVMQVMLDLCLGLVVDMPVVANRAGRHQNRD